MSNLQVTEHNAITLGVLRGGGTGSSHCFIENEQALNAASSRKTCINECRTDCVLEMLSPYGSGLSSASLAPSNSPCRKERWETDLFQVPLHLTSSTPYTLVFVVELVFLPMYAVVEDVVE